MEIVIVRFDCSLDEGVDAANGWGGDEPATSVGASGHPHDVLGQVDARRRPLPLEPDFPGRFRIAPHGHPAHLHRVARAVRPLGLSGQGDPAVGLDEPLGTVVLSGVLPLDVGSAAVTSGPVATVPLAPGIVAIRHPPAVIVVAAAAALRIFALDGESPVRDGHSAVRPRPSASVGVAAGIPAGGHPPHVVWDVEHPGVGAAPGEAAAGTVAPGVSGPPPLRPVVAGARHVGGAASSLEPHLPLEAILGLAA